MIEDTTTKITEYKNEVQAIVEEITKFWGSLVQDEQLNQLDAQIGEAKEQ